MTTVVTGAAGHVGGNLVRELLARGREVRAVVREDTRAVDGLDVEVVRTDVCDQDGLRAAFVGADVVYNLAAFVTISGSFGGEADRTNVDGPRNVARACLEAGVRRLVHFSSIHAFDTRPEDGVIDETRGLAVPGRGVPAYNRTKAAGQREVLAAVEEGLDAIVIHPTAVLGPHDYKPSRMGEVILMLCRREMPALVAGGFDWVDVRDVVCGAVAAEERAAGKSSYLLSGRWTTFEELAGIVREASGVPVPRIVAPMWLARAGAPFVTGVCRLTGRRPLYTGESLHALRNHRFISCAKAARELGYAPRPLEETIADTVRWFRDCGMFGSSPACAARRT
jgi:dihydroflavonol-4-reductase